jgi:hypothetical protein
MLYYESRFEIADCQGDRRKEKIKNLSRCALQPGDGERLESENDLYDLHRPPSMRWCRNEQYDNLIAIDGKRRHRENAGARAHEGKID